MDKPSEFDRFVLLLLAIIGAWAIYKWLVEKALRVIDYHYLTADHKIIEIPVGVDTSGLEQSSN